VRAIFKTPHGKGGQPVRDQEPHFLLCYQKEQHHAHGHK